MRTAFGPAAAWFALGLITAWTWASAELGMYTGAPPTWGDKWNQRWGDGPEALMEEAGWQDIEPDLDLVRRVTGVEPAVRLETTQVVYTREADGAAKLYIDGAEVAAEHAPGGLDPWDAELRLALANELTEDRPWVGAYHRVALYNRALEPVEVEERYLAAAPERLEGLQALYHFDTGEGGVVHDVSGQEPPLDLHISDTDAVAWTGDGLEARYPVLIATEGSAERLTEAVKESGAFTLEAWITPFEQTQTGPARIVTLSADVNARNFTLGQLEDAYEMRFRTTANGEPPLLTPGSEAGGRFIAASRPHAAIPEAKGR